jgi:tRNA threonylcarbamoyladenosine biosynthesis protein TsaB
MKHYLLIRADSPEIEVHIYIDEKKQSSKTWQAGRELSIDLHKVISKLCEQSDIKLENIEGIAVYQGPGSYTGLRISISVANALGYSLKIPVVGATGDNWKEESLEKLRNSKNFVPVSPVYGGEVYTTSPKK